MQVARMLHCLLAALTFLPTLVYTCNGATNKRRPRRPHTFLFVSKIPELTRSNDDQSVAEAHKSVTFENAYALSMIRNRIAWSIYWIHNIKTRLSKIMHPDNYSKLQNDISLQKPMILWKFSVEFSEMSALPFFFPTNSCCNNIYFRCVFQSVSNVCFSIWSEYFFGSSISTPGQNRNVKK